MSSDRPAADVVPRDYTELFRIYHPVLCSWARSRWDVHPNEVHDVVSAMWELCLRRDILARYDPAQGRFLTFLLTVFHNHLRTVQRSRQRQARHGHHLLFDPAATDTAWLVTRIGDQLATGFDEIEQTEDLRQLTTRLRERLVQRIADQPHGSSVAGADLLAMWDEMVRCAVADLPCTGATFAALLGIPERSARQRRAWIVQQLRADLEAVR
jgi:DNA-directed RNA polymerase specialized sigma24 family protein